MNNNHFSAKTEHFVHDLMGSNPDKDIFQSFIIFSGAVLDGTISKQVFNTKTSELLAELERREKLRKKRRRLEVEEQLEHASKRPVPAGLLTNGDQQVPMALDDGGQG